MAVELNTLFHKVNGYDFHLVAGKGGMRKYVNWFQISENIHSIDFIEENSIIFTSGLNIENEEDLEELVLLQSQSRASGTILVLGSRIPSVPQGVLDYCNQNDYPLFTINQESELSKIMRILSYEILRSEKASIELSAALKDAISFPYKQELYLPVFKSYGFLEHSTYCMAIVEPGNEGDCLEMGQTVKMVKIIEKILMSYGDKSFIINSDNTFQILFSNYTAERIRFIVEKILSALKKMHDKGFYVSIGANLNPITQISQSYQYAKKINIFLKKQGRKNEIYEFEKMGLYKVLMSIDQTEVIEDYFTETLGKILDYDRKNGTNLYEVLRLYLENDGSVKTVADYLFLHRNSINYKMNKIEEILGCKLSSTEVRTKLYMAYLMENFV